MTEIPVKKFYAVVDWYEENKGSVVSIDNVPEESRFEGAVCEAVWDDGKKYKAKIFKISADPVIIETADINLNKEISARMNVNLNSKRRTKAKSSLGRASDADIAAALGEKRKLTTKQAASRKIIKKAAKDSSKLSSKAMKTFDAGLLKKQAKSSQLSSATPSKPFEVNFDDSSDIDNKFDSDDDDDVTEKVANNCALIEKSKNSTGVNENMVPWVNKLMDLKNPNTVEFLTTLLGIFSENSSQDSKALNKTVDEGKNTQFAKPITKPGVTLCQLREGYNLEIAKAEKNRLLLFKEVPNKNVPYKLLKKLLVSLYGNEQLKQMTAMGTHGYFGIPEQDLLAIYSFINKHTEGIPWEDYVKQVNKKCASLRENQSKANDSKSESQDQQASTSDKPDENINTETEATPNPPQLPKDFQDLTEFNDDQLLSSVLNSIVTKDCQELDFSPTGQAVSSSSALAASTPHGTSDSSRGVPQQSPFHKMSAGCMETPKRRMTPRRLMGQSSQYVNYSSPRQHTSDYGAPYGPSGCDRFYEPYGPFGRSPNRNYPGHGTPSSRSTWSSAPRPMFLMSPTSSQRSSRHQEYNSGMYPPHGQYLTYYGSAERHGGHPYEHRSSAPMPHSSPNHENYYRQQPKP